MICVLTQGGSNEERAPCTPGSVPPSGLITSAAREKFYGLSIFAADLQEWSSAGVCVDRVIVRNLLSTLSFFFLLFFFGLVLVQIWKKLETRLDGVWLVPSRMEGLGYFSRNDGNPCWGHVRGSCFTISPVLSLCFMEH